MIQFRALTFLVAFTLLSGTLFYRTVEGWSVVDAFYFSATTFGRLFTVAYIFAGLGLIAGFINTVTRETLSIRRRERSSGGENQHALGG
jgi:voltage-gated potassium channel